MADIMPPYRKMAGSHTGGNAGEDVRNQAVYFAYLPQLIAIYSNERANGYKPDARDCKAILAKLLI